MFHRLIVNDIKKSKTVTLIIVFFIALAVMLATLATIVIINLTGSVQVLMDQAKTPHFLQMHTGDIDTKRLHAFADSHQNVADFQILDYYNVENTNIIADDKSFASNAQDNGVSIQSDRFDYLLDLDGNIIQAKPGQVYAPINYMKDDTVHVGDIMSFGVVKLRVAGFLRDSQMNSSLSSSKRFLVHEEDYKAISDAGDPEYLIEFMLKDTSKLGDFETDYVTAGLEANGPTITLPLFRMINAISDGIVAAVLILVSILVVLVTLLSVRLTLSAKLEDEYREIGVMKAIGLTLRETKTLYLVKYVAITVLAVVIGYGLALIIQKSLVGNIRLYMGDGDPKNIGIVLGAIVAITLGAIIIGFISHALSKIKKISAAEAVKGIKKKSGKVLFAWFELNKTKYMRTNIFLGIKQVLSNTSTHVTLLIVFVISFLIVSVPYSLYTTVADKSFITYMGVGSSDVRIDIQQTDSIAQKALQIADYAQRDATLSSSDVSVTESVKIKLANGSEDRIKISLSNNLQFEPQYVEGTAPRVANEISVSKLLADDLEVSTGSSIALMTNSGNQNLKITGVYSDVTNGGKTAKGVFEPSNTSVLWATVNLKVKDSSAIDTVVSSYQKRYPFAKITSVKAYTEQTFGTTIDAMNKITYISAAAAALLTLLITVLTVQMFIAKDRSTIASQIAIGMSQRDITKQYVVRIGCIALVAICVGLVLNYFAGSYVVGVFLSTLGAVSTHVPYNILIMYAGIPISLLAVVLFGVGIATKQIKYLSTVEGVKEQ